MQDLVGAVVALELAPDLGDLGEGAGVLLLVLGVEHVGVEIGEEGVLGPAGGVQAVSQGVVGGRLRGDVLRRDRLDDGADLGLGLGELFQAGEALGPGEPGLALADRARRRRP